MFKKLGISKLLLEVLEVLLRLKWHVIIRHAEHRVKLDIRYLSCTRALTAAPLTAPLMNNIC